MGEPDENPDRQAICQSRLRELLDELAKQGLTQLQIATKAALPTQYVSDLKHGRRSLTELTARRLGEEFRFNYQWLLGLTNSKESVVAWPGSAGARPPSNWLPCFAHPVKGEPRLAPVWDGAAIEVCGTAASRVALAKWPYILRFGYDDVRARIRKGDLILVSQSVAEDAEIQIVEHRKELFLARRQPDQTWERVGNGKQLPATSVIAGHCVGIIWSSLLS